MPRTYSVSSENILVAAAQDLLQIKGASGKIIRIKEINLGCTDGSLATGQMLELRCRFLPATVTDGSGGGTPTPRRMDVGDSAASFTALSNNTTPATTNGTAGILREDSAHLYSPYTYPFPVPPVVGPSESFVFELLNAPSGTVHLSVGAVVEEYGG